MAEVVTTAPTPLRERWRWLGWPVGLYVGLRIGFLVVLAVADPHLHSHLSLQFDRWDGAWFVAAAEHGWPHHVPTGWMYSAETTIAFFPGLPLAIRALSLDGTISPVAVGLVISAVTGLTATLAIAHLARRVAGEEVGTKTTVLFVLFPATFIFSLIYAEGIVLTAVALGLLCLLDRRWLAAGALGAIATFTSPVALAFVGAAGVVALTEVVARRTWRALLAPLVGMVGIAAYMAYLWQHTGSLGAWRAAELHGWRSSPSLTFTIGQVGKLLTDPFGQTETTVLLVAGTAVAIVGLVFLVRRGAPLAVTAYGILAVCLAAVSAPVGLRPRFIMIAFPVLIGWAWRVTGRWWVLVLVVTSATMVWLSFYEFWTWAIFP
jgi:hypothetical protein